jgi:ABC-type cobalamin transport system ATPase subunit
MKQALTVAAAWCMSPCLHFLDKPTTGFDVVTARFLNNVISKLGQHGLTVFFSTQPLKRGHNFELFAWGLLRGYFWLTAVMTVVATFILDSIAMLSGLVLIDGSPA